MIKIVATRCYILRLKYTRFDFPANGVHVQHSPDLLAGFKGPTLRRERTGARKERKGKEKGREEKGEGGRKGGPGKERREGGRKA